MHQMHRSALFATLLLAGSAASCAQPNEEPPIVHDDITPSQTEQPLAASHSFHEWLGCSFDAAQRQQIEDAWDGMYTNNNGPMLIQSDDFKKALSRQVWDFDIFGALGGSDSSNEHPLNDTCRNMDNPSDTTAYPRDWNYTLENGYGGWRYWTAQLLNGESWPAVTNNAQSFTYNEFVSAHAPTVFYSLNNTDTDVEFHCHHPPGGVAWSASSRGISEPEHMNAASTANTSMMWIQGTMLHEAMHNRHFSHSCGRPEITLRTAWNTIDTTNTLGHGWHNDSYAGASPPRALKAAIDGSVISTRLFSDSSVGILNNTGKKTYPNDWTNHQLLYFPNLNNVRLFFKTINTEQGFDTIKIYDDDDQLAAEYSGHHGNVWTPWIKGPKIKITFQSDASIPGGCQADSDCNIWTHTKCDTAHHVCYNPTESSGALNYNGYEVVTYEAFHTDNERLTDLYRNSATELRDAQLLWDRVHPYHMVNDYPIQSPNYMKPATSNAISSVFRTSIKGTINGNADVDAFKVWARKGLEGWTNDDAAYTLKFETAGSLNTSCKLFKDSIIDPIVTSNSGGPGANCKLSAPINHSSHYYVEVETESNNSEGDYTAIFDTVVRCDFADDGALNRSLAQADLLTTTGGGQALCDGDGNQIFEHRQAGSTGSACIDDPRYFKFIYEKDQTQFILTANPKASGGDLIAHLIENQGSTEAILTSKLMPAGANVFFDPQDFPPSMTDGTHYYLKIMSATGSEANTFDIQMRQGIWIENLNIGPPNPFNEVSVTFTTNVPAHTRCYGQPGHLPQGNDCNPFGALSSYESSSPTLNHTCTYIAQPGSGSTFFLEYLVGAFVPNGPETLPFLDVCTSSAPCWAIDEVFGSGCNGEPCP